VHNWLETCNKGHRFCGRTQKPILPSRLVDVGNDEQAPHLYETTEGDTGDYICLSHIWGTVKNMLKTEKSSIAERKRGIPMDILPLTFRDAVQFTRNLGYQYLWIDSLCIIQDDPADWEKEAAQMGRIYETSILTLANLQGADASAGCSWNPSCVLTTGINKVSDEGDPYTVFCREVQPPTSSATWADLKPAGHDDVLFTRGWTLQESLLSPRLLLFTKKQLIWYCNEHFQEYKNYGLFANYSLKSKKCQHLQPDRQAKMGSLLKDTLQASIEAVSTRWTKDTRIPKFQFNLGQFRVPDMSSIPVMGPLWAALEFFGAWDGIVSEYTRRHLTQGDDKLAAISALAKKCSALTEAKYLAGIWFDYYYIRDQLLWKPLRNTTPSLPCVGDCCFKSRYRAPSWSWASVDGAIEGGCTYESMIRSTIFEVLEGDCSTGVDPYGKVTAGFLRARGRVATLSQLGATISWDGRRSRYSLDWNVPIDPSLEESHGASIPPNHAQLTTSEASFLGSPITCPLDSVDERETPSTLDLASSLYLIPMTTDDIDHLRRDGLTNTSVRLVTKHTSDKKIPQDACGSHLRFGTRGW
jgi:hypothetical protein